MFPWTHAAFGYLLFLAVLLVLGRRTTKAELLAVLVGTQFADLVDKPLAWWFGVIPSGRSLGHSLAFVVPLAAVVVAIAWYRHHTRVGVAFAFGYLTHLLGDVAVAVVYWRPAELTFLLWPLLPPYPYDDAVGFVEFAASVEITGSFVLQWVAATAVGIGFLVHLASVPWWSAPRPD
jgi:hypothetical protein